MRSILKTFEENCAPVEHPENSEENRAPARRILKILKKIALPRGASLKSRRCFIQNCAPIRSILKIRSIFHAGHVNEYTDEHACIHTYIHTYMHTYPKQPASGFLHGGQASPGAGILKLFHSGPCKGRHLKALYFGPLHGLAS